MAASFSSMTVRRDLHLAGGQQPLSPLHGDVVDFGVQRVRLDTQRLGVGLVVQFSAQQIDGVGFGEPPNDRRLDQRFDVFGANGHTAAPLARVDDLFVEPLFADRYPPQLPQPQHARSTGGGAPTCGPVPAPAR